MHFCLFGLARVLVWAGRTPPHVRAHTPHTHTHAPWPRSRGPQPGTPEATRLGSNFTQHGQTGRAVRGVLLLPARWTRDPARFAQATRAPADCGPPRAHLEPSGQPQTIPLRARSKLDLYPVEERVRGGRKWMFLARCAVLQCVICVRKHHEFTAPRSEGASLQRQAAPYQTCCRLQSESNVSQCK